MTYLRFLGKGQDSNPLFIMVMEFGGSVTLFVLIFAMGVTDFKYKMRSF